MKLALTFFIALGVLSATPATVTLLGPTTLSVNGKNETILSIDSDGFSQLNSSWKANLSSVGGNIAETYHPQDPTRYEKEAYLYTQITKPGVSSQQTQELQDAVWYLTDSSYNPLLEAFLKYDLTWGLNSSKIQTFTHIANDLKNAESAIKTMDFSAFTIVSQADSSERLRNREYIYCDPTVAPEPATNALLGTALALGGVGRFLFRRKKSVKA